MFIIKFNILCKLWQIFKIPVHSLYLGYPFSLAKMSKIEEKKLVVLSCLSFHWLARAQDVGWLVGPAALSFEEMCNMIFCSSGEGLRMSQSSLWNT